MDIIRLIFAITYAYFIGYCITNLILAKLKSKTDLFSYIGLCGIIGFGMSAIELFALSLFKLPWHQAIIVLPWLIIFIYLVLKKQYKFQVIEVKKIDYAVLLLFVVLVLALLGWTLINPIFVWDGWAIWNLKAQAFFYQNSVSPSFFKDPLANISHLEYPILLPLSQTWIYLFLARVQEGFSQIVYLVYYFSMACISFGFFKSISKKYVLPLILSTLLALTPILISASQINYADILIGILFLCSLDFLIIWIKHGQRADLYFTTILLGLSAFTKQEGGVIFAVFILFIALTTIFSDKAQLLVKAKSVAFPILIGLIPWIVWWVYRKVYGLELAIPSSGIDIHYLIENTSRFKIIFSAMREQLIAHPFSSSDFYWNPTPSFCLIWPLSTLIAIIAFIYKLETRRYYFIVFATIIFFIAIYYIVPADQFEWYLATSLNRLMLQATPALITLSFFSLIILWSKNKNI